MNKNNSSNPLSTLPAKFKLNHAAIFFVICVNIGIFFYANRQPILWQHPEMAFERYYWSADISCPEKNILRTGFHIDDFKKIFSFFRLDTGFRTRQFSYLIEIISFKLWQYLGIVSFHDLTLIFIHIINTLIFCFVSYLLTKQKYVVILSSMLFLNSGVAQATLFFPFRSAKLLIITLFLLAWIYVLTASKNFSNLPSKKKYAFWGIVFLAVFTDEIFVFLFPIIFFHIVLKHGKKEVFKFDFLTKAFGTLFLIVAIVFLFYNIAINIDPHISIKEQSNHLQYLYSSIGSWDILTNSLEAFFFYFLRFLFGSWDASLWGIISAISTIVLFLLCFHKNKTINDNLLSFFMILMIFVKAILFPNSYGVQNYIMPPHATFASFLYFSYYYTYPDSALIILVFTLQANRSLLKKQKG